MLRTMLFLIGIGLLAPGVLAQTDRTPPAASGPSVPPPQAVTLETEDGIKIAADFYPSSGPADKKAPVVVLIHMYPADRKSWAGLAPELQRAGLAALAYDIRGTGGSTGPADRKLHDKYAARDTEHFKSAVHDVEAAKAWLAKQPGCDAERLALVGASIGCSIALEYGSRDPAVKAIVCLSPGTDYFGLDSIAAIKKCIITPILLVSPDGEYAAVEELKKAGGAHTEGRKFPGGRERHGTGLLTADYGPRVMTMIVSHISRGVFAPERTTATDRKRHLLKQPTTKRS